MITVSIENDPAPELYEELLTFPGATVYHSQQWHRVLRASFGWPVRIAAVRTEDGTLVAAMPFIRRLRMGFRRLNVCLPMTDVVGPLFRSPDHEGLIVEMAGAASPVEIRSSAASQDFDEIAYYTRSVIDLSGAGTAEDLKKTFNRKSVLKRLRRAEREGVSIREGCARSDYDLFADLVARTRRRHGAPSFPADFFSGIFEEFAADKTSRLHLAYQGDRCVAGQFFFHFHGRAISAYSASLPERGVQRSGANQLVKWHAIQAAFDYGARSVDLGIANLAQPSLRCYKENWGASSEPLKYAYYPPGKQAFRIGQESKLGKLAKLVFSAMPMPLYKRITPAINRLAA